MGNEKTVPTITKNTFDLEDKIMLIPVNTADILLKEEDGCDAVALYIFYYKTAKRQKTNQIWASQSFCLKALKWGDRRFTKAKKILEKYNLVELVKGHSINDKWYIKINYIKSNLRQNENIRQSEEVRSGVNLRQNEVLDSNVTNALSTINRNAYIENKDKDFNSSKPNLSPIQKRFISTVIAAGLPDPTDYLQSEASYVKKLTSNQAMKYAEVRGKFK